MEKRGSTQTVENIISVVLVIAFIFILIGMIWALQPIQNLNEEYAKLQLKEIESKLDYLDKNGGTLEHLVIATPEESRFFLINFENNQNINYIEKDFFLNRKTKNAFCICYIEKENFEKKNPICSSCISLKEEAILEFIGIGVQGIELVNGRSIELNKKEDYYEIISKAEEGKTYIKEKPPLMA
jgi:hypothetical protein